MEMGTLGWVAAGSTMILMAAIALWNDIRKARQRDKRFDESNALMKRWLDECAPCPTCQGSGRILR